MGALLPRSPEWYRAVYQDISTSGSIAAGTAGAAAVVPLVANTTIFVQKVFLDIQTAAANTITFQDNAGTPVKPIVVPASQAAGHYVYDFGARGFALTEGKQLDIAGTAGPAYAYGIEGYRRQTSATQATTADRTV